MAREDVNIKVSANVAEAIRLWKAMEAGPQGMANELDALGKKGKAAGDSMGQSFEKVLGTWASIGAAIAAAKLILDKFMQSQQAAADRLADSSRTADKMSRELLQLAPGRALKQIQTDIGGLAERRGASPQATKDVMAALLGAGYTYEAVVQGGGADAVLQTMAATNAIGKGADPKALTDAITGHLEATKQAKTPENLRAAGMAVQGLFAGTKLEITDLQQLAPKGSNIYNITGMQNEQIAMLSMMKDVTTADVGSTSMQAAMTSLLDPKGRAVHALKELGLTRDQVDFQGESPLQVAETIVSALERAPEHSRARLRSQLFKTEGASAGNEIYSRLGIEKYKERLAMMNDPAGFAQSAAVMEGGLEAQANRAEAGEMLVNAREDFVDPTIARKKLLQELEKAGVSRRLSFGAEMRFDVANWWKKDAAYAVHQALDPMPPLSGKPLDNNRGVAGQIIEQSRSQPVEVRVELVDQNQIAIPHKNPVTNLSRPIRLGPSALGTFRRGR